MMAEARQARQVESVSPAQPVVRSTARRSPVWALAVSVPIAILAPFAIFAPKWFARRFAEHLVTVPLLLAAMLAGAWLAVHATSTRTTAAWLLMGAFGLVGMWAVATGVSVSLVARWDESEKRASYKAGSMVFSFAAGFCLLLLGLYWFGADAAERIVLPHIRDNLSRMAGFRLSLLLGGLVLSVAAPIQIFRGLVSVGGGHAPAVEPLCRDCGYSLEGVAQTYRARHGNGDAEAPAVCSECGCPLAASLDIDARPGTTWTRDESRGLRAWWTTRRQVMRDPFGFFAALPMDTPRSAAVRFWSGNLLATLGMMAILFLANDLVCRTTRIAFPLPITGYQSPTTMQNVPEAIWLPATLIGMTLVMYAVVMGAMLALCGTAEVVWKRVCMLRGSNMHPAGLAMVCYLSGHAFRALTAATAAFLAMRLAVMAIPPTQRLLGFLRYEQIMELRANSGNIAIVAGCLVAGIGMLRYWNVAQQAGRAMRYANR